MAFQYLRKPSNLFVDIARSSVPTTRKTHFVHRRCSVLKGLAAKLSTRAARQSDRGWQIKDIRNALEKVTSDGFHITFDVDQSTSLLDREYLPEQVQKKMQEIYGLPDSCLTFGTQVIRTR